WRRPSSTSSLSLSDTRPSPPPPRWRTSPDSSRPIGPLPATVAHGAPPALRWRLPHPDDFGHLLSGRPDLVGDGQHARPQLVGIAPPSRLAAPDHDHAVARPDPRLFCEQDEETPHLPPVQIVHPPRRLPFLRDRHASIVEDPVRPACQTVLGRIEVPA